MGVIITAAQCFLRLRFVFVKCFDILRWKRLNNCKVLSVQLDCLHISGNRWSICVNRKEVSFFPAFSFLILSCLPPPPPVCNFQIVVAGSFTAVLEFKVIYWRKRVQKPAHVKIPRPSLKKENRNNCVGYVFLPLKLAIRKNCDLSAPLPNLSSLLPAADSIV